jgi:hypothetical protein
MSLAVRFSFRATAIISPVFLVSFFVSGCVHTAPFKDARGAVLPQSAAVMEQVKLAPSEPQKIRSRSYRAGPAWAKTR